MKKIRLTNFRVDALVDDEDYAELITHTWYLSKAGYASRSYWIPERKQSGTVYMHRHILKTEKGFDTEHIDQNKLNNQRANLRTATRSENMANLPARGGLSKHKGVSRLKRPKLKKPWLAYIKLNYKTYYLGYFETEEEAAHMYNQFAEQIYGEFASLNDV